MKLIVKMSAPEAVAALRSGALSNLVEVISAEKPEVAGEDEPKKEAPKKKTTKKSKPTQIVSELVPKGTLVYDSEPEPPTTPVEPEPKQPIVEAPAPAPTAPTRTYTIDDIQKAAVALVNKGKMADLQALLKEFNVSAITQLPDDMQVRAAFMNRVEVIGGQA